MIKRCMLALAALLGVAAAPPAPLARPAQADPAVASRMRAHVEFLASDLLEGRDTGSRGHEIAAAYVATQFKLLGLQPGGPNGSWYQQVPFRRATHAAPPEMSIIRGGQRAALKHGHDLALRPSLTQKERSIDAPLVFVGHGISEPRLGIDEYAGLDVRGKIVVTLRGTPQGLPSDVAAHLQSAKDDTAAAKGAIGFAELSFGSANPAVMAADRPVLDWVTGSGQAGPSGLLGVVLILSPEFSAKLFDGAPKSLDAVAKAAKAPIRGFDLPVRLSLRATSKWEDFTSPQILARLPGTDPQLAREHVVLMGHLDHLGTRKDAKPGEDHIFNGALDNASGIATMIEAARAFTSTGTRPRRSILFAAVTGEEKGLRGADFLAANPPVPVGDIVGLVNIDMPLLLYPFSDVIAFGAEHSTVARAVAQSGRSMGVAVAADPMPTQSLFVRSDHYRFVVRGIPSVFLMTGYANGGKEAWDKFFGNGYHRVSDDIAQPIDWNAAARFAELNYRIARSLADNPQRPLWYRGSFFGESFAPGQPRAER